MITLDPALQAAQNGNEHEPLIKLVSSPFVDAIPLEGTAFNDLSMNETNPDVFEHSTGRIVSVVTRSQDVMLILTDTSKAEWFEHKLYDGNHTVHCIQVCVCELADGNLGVVYLDNNMDIWGMVSDISGVIQEERFLIQSYNDSTENVSSPSLTVLTDGSYLLVYAFRNDSDEYSIQKRTSSDFLTWSASTTITPTGLDVLQVLANPSIKQLTSGEIFLLFDYATTGSGDSSVINCYLIISSDAGVTWSAPTNLTQNIAIDTVSQNPVVAERLDGSVEIAYFDEKGALHMNESSPGFLAPDDRTTTVSFNAAENKLYTAQQYTYVGTKSIKGITVIDVPTWTIDKVYTSSSSPAYDNYFDNVHATTIGDGKYIGSSSGSSMMVINPSADTIKEYHIKDIDAYGITSNIDALYAGPYTEASLEHAQIVDSQDRLYVWMIDNYVYRLFYAVGYIDLTEVPDPITGKYTWHEVFATGFYDDTRPLGGQYQFFNNTSFYVDANTGIIVLSGHWDNEDGRLVVYDINTGAELYDFHSDIDPSFPKYGVTNVSAHNGHVYGNIDYEPLYGNEDRYGLLDITLSTGAMMYHRPTWATQDNYSLVTSTDMGDGRLLFPVYGTGIATFNTTDYTWTVYDDDNIPGLSAYTDSKGWYTVDYDPASNIIFAGATDPWGGDIVAIPEIGLFKQVEYITGTYDSNWDFSEVSPLIDGYSSSQPSIVVDETNSLWVLWSDNSGTYTRLYWAQEVASRNITEYLTDSAVTLNWEIDRPGSLDFTLSHGHLFDPSNTMSVLAPILTKGKKITIQLGEKIGDNDYYQDQGTFIIIDVKLSYRRDTYPTISVNCESLDFLWAESIIPASEFFSDAEPNYVLSELVTEHGDIASGNVNFPDIANAHDLYYQFIDIDLRKALGIVLDHFGYFLHFNVDGTPSARRIDLTQDVDHVYTDEIIDYTPDDSFSTFTNRIICSGEGRYFVEVLMAIEPVGTLSGTVLPFGGTITKRVWYSEDHQRTCKTPYLTVNESIRDYELFLMKGGGDEFISAIDVDEKYVDIEIEAPELTALYIGLLVAIGVTGYTAMTCGHDPSHTTNSCGPYIFALALETQALGYAIGAVARYDYEVQAYPVGHVKQTFQAEANDLVFQRELGGRVVLVEIEDPLCYEITHCQDVVDRELSVVQAQRRRVSFSKVTHLQDEIGDMVQINHPYTASELKIFIVKIVRSYQKGFGVVDKMEGWRA